MPRRTDDGDEPDFADIDHLRELLASPGWALVAKRLQVAHQQALQALTVAATWEDARKHQGAIAAYQVALRTPETLLVEARKSTK